MASRSSPTPRPVSTVRQRLELMAKVCDAVHHAHQRGIIHRDLKPGNILVDESGQPKILDFGVARVTDSDTHATRQTDVGQLVGRFAYMSPEQVLADPLALDVRSDVYALGVILYELLAGQLPYQASRQIHEAARAIWRKTWKLSSINRAYRGDSRPSSQKRSRRTKPAAIPRPPIWRPISPGTSKTNRLLPDPRALHISCTSSLVATKRWCLERSRSSWCSSPASCQHMASRESEACGAGGSRRGGNGHCDQRLSAE